MTTPEALRRRQLVEGAVLIALGAGMLGQGWYFASVDRDQQACLARNFGELSQALDARESLSARETRAAERVNLAELRAGTEAQFLAELRRYQTQIEAIEAERRDNPLPPFPPGTCSD